MADVRARLGDVDGAMTDAMTYGQYSQDPPQSRLIEDIQQIVAESSGDAAPVMNRQSAVPSAAAHSSSLDAMSNASPGRRSSGSIHPAARRAMALERGRGNQHVQRLLRSERSGPPPMLRVGSRGAAVRTLQARLAGRGAPIAADGIFGPRTGAAVQAFQRSSGLQVDGIVGPKTWRRLLAGGRRRRRQVPAEVLNLYRRHQVLTGRLERQRVDIAGKLDAAALLVVGAATSGAAPSGVAQEAKAPPPASSAHGWLDEAGEWIEEQADEAGDWVEEQADEASDWIEEQADDASDWIEEQVDDASDWIEEQVDDASDWVEEQVDDASD